MAADQLQFADVESLQDLGTFVSRARALDADGAIRLQASGASLGAWVCPLPGKGVLGQGVVLGLRVMPLAGPHELDVTVPLAAISDRLARRERTGDVTATLEVPPAQVVTPWAAMAPPLRGWQPGGVIDQGQISQVAKDSVTEIGRTLPDGTGAHLVAGVRDQVWGRRHRSDDGTEWTAGVAWAALSLGFLGGEAPAQVWQLAPWTRISLPNGHVLTR